MYELPSLMKTAFYACNEIERKKFDLLETPDVDMLSCCESLFEMLKIDKTRNEDNDRLTMFSRSHIPINDRRFENICERAAFYGHINCLKLAHEIGVPWNRISSNSGNACDEAAQSGNLECLRYSWQNGCTWNEFTCIIASINGHLDCLAFARENGCPWNGKTCSGAAWSGRLECLIYARENGCPWDQWTCSYAARNGHLSCLVYAQEHGCPWNWLTCTYAAYNGHFDCLVFAHERGCKLDREFFINASKNDNNSKCIEYGLKHVRPVPSGSTLEP